MALTLKKRLFADAIMLGETNTEAAITAGYSKNTAAQAGSRLAKDEDVSDYIQAKKAEKKQVAEKTVHVKRNVVDPREALIELLNDPDPNIVLKVASTLMPYYHAKVEASGKKETQRTNAKQATTTGRFATLSNQSELAASKIQ